MPLSLVDFLTPHHNWTEPELCEIAGLPLNDLMFYAQSVHRHNFPDNKLQLSTLLNIKSGSCPEDCRYCSQSAHYKTGLPKNSTLIGLDVVEESIQKAKALGADRFCFAAAWRSLTDRNLDYVCSIIELTKKFDIESCASLGMLTKEHAAVLKRAGLDYYNHNIDTSREHYGNVVTTRSYDDRLATLKVVADSGIKICCGGILGIGESQKDRILMVLQLANLSQHPESVPINMLVPIPGTPMMDTHTKVDPIEFIRIIALARLVLPKTYIRLAAGRSSMTEEMHALCFFVGANSIFVGDTLLTTPNNPLEEDVDMLQKLGQQ